MFNCKACPEKDARIHDLLDQIKMLRQVAYPTLDKNKQSLESMEMDAILGGSDDLIPVHEEDYELASLFGGDYDNSQVEVE